MSAGGSASAGAPETVGAFYRAVNEGSPDEAIPYLEKRLNWPDQRETVQAELDLAKRNAGEG